MQLLQSQLQKSWHLCCSLARMCMASRTCLLLLASATRCLMSKPATPSQRAPDSFSRIRKGSLAQAVQATQHALASAAESLWASAT